MDETRILVADDDDAIADIIAAYLKREGATVVRAVNGVQTLDQARLGGWSLILLDVMMPRLDGFEVCRRLRAESVDVPVLFLTAWGEEIDQVLGLGLGADDYIVKPFSGAALTARVKAHIRRYRELKGATPAAPVELLRFHGLLGAVAGLAGGSLGSAMIQVAAVALKMTIGLSVWPLVVATLAGAILAVLVGIAATVDALQVKPLGILRSE